MKKSLAFLLTASILLYTSGLSVGMSAISEKSTEELIVLEELTEDDDSSEIVDSVELQETEELQTDDLTPKSDDTEEYEGSCGQNASWILSDGVLTISGYGPMKNYYSASAIPWYSYADTIKSLVIEDGITSIGRLAFCNCSNMTNTTISDSVEKIGSFAFEGCHSLKSISIPRNVISIESYVFSECFSLENIYLPNGLKSIEYHAFEFCDSLKAINIPENVSYIAEGAFYGCTELTEIDIPSGITEIETRTFVNCTKLGNAILPSSISHIADYAFKGCSNLNGISIPYGVESIGESAFKGCCTLTSISIPGSVKTIETSAFYNCSALTSLTISEGVNTIGEAAFQYCASLSSVTIPASVTAIGEGAFDCCGDNFIVYGYTGSTAESYCEKYDIPFESIGGEVLITAPSSMKIGVGSTAVLDAKTEPEMPVTYSSSDTSIVTVNANTGKLQGIKAGTALIVMNAAGASPATCSVTVYDALTSVSLNCGSKLTLNVGDSLEIIPVLDPIGAEAVYTWKTSSTKIATVNENGLLTAMNEGKATITVVAVSGKIKKTAALKITVVDPHKPTAVTLDPSSAQTIDLGDTLWLEPVLTPDSAEAEFSWKSSSTKIATVNEDGMVTGIAEGKASITVTATRGTTKKVAKVTVTVVDPYKPVSVSIEPTETQVLEINDTISLEPVLNPATAEAEITWKSSSPKIATVDEDGKVTAIAEGKATITVIATHGKIKKSAKLTVSVVDPLKPSKVTISGDEWGIVGDEYNLEASVLPVTANECSFVWKSSSTKVATVVFDGEYAVVTGIKAGTATITCTATYTDANGKKTSKSGSYKIKVDKG